MGNELIDFTRLEANKRLKETKIAILPLGAIEQHGHHLPLGTDAMLAEKMAVLVANEIDAIVLPTFYFGYSWVWRDIPGTITLDQPILQQTLQSIALSVQRNGFEILLIINGHEANSATLKYLVRDMSDISDLKVLNIFYPGLMENYNDVFESKTWYGMFHADEFETSMMLHHYPDLVSMEKAIKEYPRKPESYGHDDTSIGDLSDSGVYGDPTVATKEKGEIITDIVLDKIKKIVNSII